MTKAWLILMLLGAAAVAASSSEWSSSEGDSSEGDSSSNWEEDDDGLDEWTDEFDDDDDYDDDYDDDESESDADAADNPPHFCDCREKGRQVAYSVTMGWMKGAFSSNKYLRFPCYWYPDGTPGEYRIKGFKWGGTVYPLSNLELVKRCIRATGKNKGFTYRNMGVWCPKGRDYCFSPWSKAVPNRYGEKIKIAQRPWLGRAANEPVSKFTSATDVACCLMEVSKMIGLWNTNPMNWEWTPNLSFTSQTTGTWDGKSFETWKPFLKRYESNCNVHAPGWIRHPPYFEFFGIPKLKVKTEYDETTRETVNQVATYENFTPIYSKPTMKNSLTGATDLTREEDGRRGFTTEDKDIILALNNWNEINRGAFVDRCLRAHQRGKGSEQDFTCHMSFCPSSKYSSGALRKWGKEFLSTNLICPKGIAYVPITWYSTLDPKMENPLTEWIFKCLPNMTTAEWEAERDRKEFEERIRIIEEHSQKMFGAHEWNDRATNSRRNDITFEKMMNM